MLVGLTLLLAYAVLMGSFSGSSIQYLSYLAVGFIVMFLLVMIPFGGIAIMKSDMDYLFTLPLKRWELAFSMYVIQFLATGVAFVFTFGYVLPYMTGNLLEKVTITLDMALIAMLITGFGVVAYSMGTRSKAFLAFIASLWAASPVFGFNYSFTSVFFGQIAIGSILAISVTIPLTVVALRQLESIELGFTKVSIRASSDIYKNQIDYGHHTPIGSIYLYNLTQLNLTSRLNMGLSTSSRSSRVSLRKLLIPMAVIAAIYAATARNFGNFDEANTVVIIASVYISIFIPTLFSQSVLSYERAWLAFTSMPVYVYWRNVAFSKFIQIEITILPFVLASAYLHFNGVAQAINTIPLFALSIPSVTVIVMYLAGVLVMDQVKDTGTISTQFSLKQMLIMLPVGLMLLVAAVSVISLLASIISAAALLSIMSGIILRKDTWTGLVYKLTEHGYV